MHLATTENDTSNDINELMSLIGVAPRDYDAVRVNYERLPREEVHRRLLKFRLSRARVLTEFAEQQQCAVLTTVHPRIPSQQRKLTTANILEALARLENVVSDLKPTILVGINDEGMRVGTFIRDHLGLNTPIIIASGTAEHGIQLIAQVKFETRPVVGVIGHAAKTGATLRKVMSSAKSSLGAEKVFGAILIASELAASSFDFKSIYFHQITEKFSDSLGKSVVSCFETSDLETPQQIEPKYAATLDVVREEMAELYPTFPG